MDRPHLVPVLWCSVPRRGCLASMAPAPRRSEPAMSDLQSISDLLTTPGNLGRIVAATRGRVIDVSQLRRDVYANAECLRASGCKRGLLITEDTYWAIVGMLALFQMGAEVVLPQNATVGAITSIQEHWDVLVCDRLPAGQVGGIILQSAGEGSGELQPLDATKCYLNLFTSGSTGIPKRVRKTLAVMEREAEAIELIAGGNVEATARILGTVTHQHLFGLSYKLFWPLCSGRIVDGTVHELWESLLAQDLRGSVVITSPAHLLRLGPVNPLPAGRQPSRILSAGAVLPLLASAAASTVFGSAICEIYGSTETGTIARRERHRVDLPWQVAPGVAVEIADDGTMWVTSPFLSETTHHRCDDLAERDINGGFHLRGRTDRVVKIDGARVSLAAVEAGIAASPWVANVALVVLPGDVPALGAAVVPSEAGRLKLLEVGSFRFSRLLRQGLQDLQEAPGRPRRWRFVEALPVNDLGKTVQRDLLALFDVRRPTEPEIRAVRATSDGIELDLFTSPDLQQLEGHFPGMPIVPGVAQIDWAVKLAARHLELPVGVAMSYQVKFHRLTLPGTLLTLKLDLDAERQRLNFAYRRDDVVLTSGIIRTCAP
ncbi:MAG: acyl-CoA synthetase [Rhodospirillaceae bacterium]|nr:acyl-CoA synthetase [Rhodospirillaceae bacterium]